MLMCLGKNERCLLECDDACRAGDGITMELL